MKEELGGQKSMVKSNYIIKPFTPALSEATAEVIKRNLEEVNCKDYPPKVIDAMIKYYSPDNLNKLAVKRLVYVVEVEGTIKATGSLEGNGIYTVFVNPDYHGSGLGRLLMEYLEEQAATRGYEVTTLDASLTAFPFYAKMGYKEVRSIESEEFGKAVVMEKKLSKDKKS